MYYTENIKKRIKRKIKVNNKQKKFGQYGGQFAPEILMSALDELEKKYNEIYPATDFQNELAVI